MPTQSKIDRGDKGAYVFDEASEALNVTGFARAALDGIGTFGNGEGADTTRRTLQPMRQKSALARLGSRDLVANRQRLCDEHGQYFAAKRAVAHRLALKMIEVDRRLLKLFTGLPVQSGRPCPFTFIHWPSIPQAHTTLYG
ncbi:MAG: hypothetical protein BGO03_10165 [Mesorhizobium sp. 61-13]|nr:MAG: hypothetical protein BGO03_10165 [Mesorhizobium sp. 61-13]